MSAVTLAVSQYTTTTISTAGFALGLALLGTELWRWHKGGKSGGKGIGDDGGGKAKDPKALIPLGFGIVCGILMIACPAGLLGTIADFLRWGGNSVGDVAMKWLTGTPSQQMGTAATPRIDGYGAIVVAALFTVLFLLRKTFAKLIKGKWWKGVLVGVLLCVSTGTAAMLADQIVQGANGLGAWAIDGIAKGKLT
ncbi:hypothetical protein STRTUCAR8_08582 [Streptomyces turgidiscabies Car8]|uniref:Uncharacterized protein n=1 Tax=Streptomyces turgidiscabies (strain Car8) TaxID=698760 RepID=L7F8Y3_STRT8|nr:hypothetical protein [Streptomyces turgidiscabies]ELP67677.1 hypothetical protein STRTUCAR8_08582 [Streptomyces turgidiscabies Car8]